ncbi:hypothetical protein [uncultured Fibrobacter sp.]|uniref:hypothetical protein n=1 Tax=uncultured Fibrobacter sp. TaxID=261512 RepID=UPI0026172CB6|nr:hypothetical protein [uncultured Fibrobacter sp.]
MQDSYFAEMNAVGDKSAIGYKEPASTVFSYDVTVEGTKATFSATNTETALNDCQKDAGTWSVESEAGSSGLKHEANVTGDGCGVLTPSFTSIGAGTN